MAAWMKHAFKCAAVKCVTSTKINHSNVLQLFTLIAVCNSVSDRVHWDSISENYMKMII
jgi:hypothetical protein